MNIILLGLISITTIKNCCNLPVGIYDNFLLTIINAEGLIIHEFIFSICL